MRSLLFIVGALIGLCACAETSRPSAPVSTAVKTLGTIERLDPAFDELVPAGTVMEIIAEGFDWSEGPLWVPDDGGFLLFSDIPPNLVYKWQAGTGASVYLQQSGWLGPIPRPDSSPPDEPGSNALIRDAQGRLVLCQHGLRQMARMDAPITAPKSTFVTIADRYDGKRLNSPNDAVYHQNGDLYFTDPPYGLPRKMQDPHKELDFQGVYRVKPDGTVTLLTKSMSRPNGIAFSPDFKTLYVANSDPKRAVWMAYPVKDDGTLGDGRVFVDVTNRVGQLKGLPDGMKIDKQGNIFATGPGGLLVFNAEGKQLGTFFTGQATSNCAFGEDGKTLFVTADNFILRIRLSTTGCGF